jgi:hypothetical protein
MTVADLRPRPAHKTSRAQLFRALQAFVEAERRRQRAGILSAPPCSSLGSHRALGHPRDAVDIVGSIERAGDEVDRPHDFTDTALGAYVGGRWPGATWHREIPISAMVPTERGARRIGGTIDLLLETRSVYAIINQKSFPGRQEHWRGARLGICTTTVYLCESHNDGVREGARDVD